MQTVPRPAAMLSHALVSVSLLGLLGVAACGGSDTRAGAPAHPTTESGLNKPAATTAIRANENHPQTHIDRLKDPATRPAAIDRLVQFFVDVMVADDRNREGPYVKPLLDRIVKPMNEVCLASDLDAQSRSKLIQFMSDARRPEGEPCVVKVLQDYEVDVTEEDVRWAARAAGAMKLEAAAGPLLNAFLKMRPSRPKAGAMYRDVYDAMASLRHPSWEPQLLAVLERPLSNPKDRAAHVDEVQWQTNTAAKVLGEMRSEKAVPGLIKVMLTPSKADAQATAMLALVRIGKPAITTAVALLDGQNKDLVAYATAEALKGFGDKPTDAQKREASGAHVRTAALILATIGREEVTAPLLAALQKGDDTSRAVIARELPKLPKKPEIVKAFQMALEKTGVSVSIPPGQSAREALIDVASGFYDASLVPWLLKQAEHMKGKDAELMPLRESTLATCAKLMRSDQIKAFDKLYNAKPSSEALKVMEEYIEEDLASANDRLARAKNDKERDAIREEIAALNEQKRGPKTFGSGMAREYNLAKDLLAACGSDVDCYLSKATDPASQEETTLFRGVKALYMIGEYGTPDVRQKLLDAMPKLTSAALRFLAVSLIDYFSPKGDTEIAQKLLAIVRDAEAKRDQAMILANAPFKVVIYRLDARAQ